MYDKEYQKLYRQKNKEKLREYQKKWSQKPEVKLKRKKYLKNPNTKIKIKNYRKNPEFIKKLKKYNQRPEIKKRRNELARKRYHTIEHKEKRKKYLQKPNIKFKIYIRESIRRRIKQYNINKKYKTEELIGCTFKELKQYLEKQFKEGMTWNNHGFYGWHIDHIKPCCSFNLINEEEQKKCFNYKNLQPLWAKDNLKKSGKVDTKCY